MYESILRGAAAGLCAIPLLAGIAVARDSQPVLKGNIYIHDPSLIVVEGHYASFATGVELAEDEGTPRTKSSPDGVTWAETGALPGGLPDWIEAELGYTPKNLWAPSISERDGTHYLYYSASWFGRNDSAIGLMTNKNFDPTDPAAGWEDRGMVLRSRSGDDYNAIDPFRIDTADGRAWLAFGSHWDGIRLTELDPATGKRAEGAERVPLASRNGGAIEAPAILAHGDHYYLFVSFDACCRGAASTYRIMVGRSEAVTGPYVARDGTPMMKGGATEVLASTGRYRGPGGQEVFMGPEGPMLAYHYYDGKEGGAPKLQIAPIRFDTEGWPELDPLP